MAMADKTCPICGQTKPSSDWHRSRRSKDGLAWSCKACASARVEAHGEADRRLREQHHEEWQRLYESALTSRDLA